ncbi:hypothetical protein KEM63_05170 [Halopseudomonas nanhaiensis]|uniref:hypothetical protein n=1 Tax=Halopseudomonas nanhaiensis TaxID=2830842 RepID=UPI001CC19C75|nr:hypothetical protein [Halopseudomonas nanhaiensis]UAW99361.1 hypothetical protein KEM63_05170 [Halopseudomonas nanhaiensis]
MSYSLIKTLHLLGAIAFVGTLFVQVFILGPVMRQLPEQERARLSEALGQRARRVVHWVALVLYGAGLALGWQYRSVLAQPFSSHFSAVLTVKITLALLIVLHYVALIYLRKTHRIGPQGMHLLNVSLLMHAVLVVICAKALFVS